MLTSQVVDRLSIVPVQQNLYSSIINPIFIDDDHLQLAIKTATMTIGTYNGQATK